MFSRDSELYGWGGLNEAMFLLVNRHHGPTLDSIALAITALGHPKLYPFYLAIALSWSAWRPASLPLRNVATFAIGYVVLSMVLVPVLKGMLDFPRPLAVLGEHVVTIVGKPDAAHSFPSGHAAFAVLVAASLAPGIARAAQIALAIFALLVCVSRLSTGAHFPADVLVGALLAIAVAAAVRRYVPNRKRG